MFSHSSTTFENLFSTNSTIACPSSNFSRTSASKIPSLKKREPAGSFLPGRSSYDIIEALKEVGYRKQTVFAVLSHVPNDHLARQVMDAGGDLFLLMPLDYQFVRERFVSILRKKRRGEPAPPDENRIELERYVADLMHEVGVPAHIRGYDYIRDSILLSLEDRGMLKAITKELYPTVAKNNNTTDDRCH